MHGTWRQNSKYFFNLEKRRTEISPVSKLTINNSIVKSTYEIFTICFEFLSNTIYIYKAVPSQNSNLLEECYLQAEEG